MESATERSRATIDGLDAARSNLITARVRASHHLLMVPRGLPTSPRCCSRLGDASDLASEVLGVVEGASVAARAKGEGDRAIGRGECPRGVRRVRRTVQTPDGAAGEVSEHVVTGESAVPRARRYERGASY